MALKNAHTGQVYASIDAGGTTFKCAIIEDGPSGVLARRRVPTTGPEETLAACAQFFKDAAHDGPAPQAMGIASFGPIDVDPASPSYGMILDSPKWGWAATHLRQYFQAELGLPVHVDTDVNGALLAEMEWGAARTVSSAAYITVGTGIGAGAMSGGGLLGKPSHPEFGHIRPARHPADKDFKGVCPFHADCLEGLASATAMTKRWGDPRKLPEGHIAWDIEAYYLAQACNILSLTLRTERIILGGGIMLARHLLDNVRTQYAALISNYLGQSGQDIKSLIVTPGLGDDAGLYGGACIAKHAESG